MNTVQIRLYDLFRKDLQLSDDKAAAFVSAVEEVVAQHEKTVSQGNATKDDIHKLELKLEQSKNETNKAIYVSGLIQFLAILSSVIAIIKFMK